MGTSFTPSLTKDFGLDAEGADSVSTLALVLVREWVGLEGGATASGSVSTVTVSCSAAAFLALAAAVFALGGRPRFGLTTTGSSGTLCSSMFMSSSSSSIASIRSLPFTAAFRFVFDTLFPASLPLASASSSEPAVVRERVVVAVLRVDLREPGVFVGTLDALPDVPGLA